MAILLNGWILPINGASAVEGLLSTGLLCLVYIITEYVFTNSAPLGRVGILVPMSTTRPPNLFTRLIHPIGQTDSCSLRNKDFFRIALGDRPRVGGVKIVDRPCVET